MTNVFQAMFEYQQPTFEHQQPMESQLHAASHGFVASHARMLGKRQRSASPNANGDDGTRSSGPKRNRPAWIATPSPADEAGFAQAHPDGNPMTATGFFHLSNTMPTAGTSPFEHRQPSAHNPYPFPFPSPNHLSPSGLVLPDSSMTAHTAFIADEKSKPTLTSHHSRPSDITAPGFLPLEREGSHGSLHDLRIRMASSGIEGYKDLPSVIDDSANDGDDEMAMPSASIRLPHTGPHDVSMDLPVPRPPRNSFSSFAHASNETGHGAADNPFASMISDRLARTTSGMGLKGENGEQDVSRRSNVSDSMGAAEQYFVDGMRRLEQQHQDWSSPAEPYGNDVQQQSGSSGDIDMIEHPEQLFKHHAPSSIERAQADLHQVRQEQQRQHSNQIAFDDDAWRSGSHSQGLASHSTVHQHAFQVPNSTQAIHNKQKFTMGPRPDCPKCLAGSSGHAGHWL
ncbi:hypothetical protein NliqN6_1877 [Naganishia liquefaciens]|uniref:Uncharacterized protein n=1 Tax=Naganishia liquefaciens TaxID=104408 RepID=A0A8H3TQQ8_9TREE|nr:hypothetical protein NliqN6_1877 [Naganishia liquefaciens]